MYSSLRVRSDGITTVKHHRNPKCILLFDLWLHYFQNLPTHWTTHIYFSCASLEKGPEPFWDVRLVLRILHIKHLSAASCRYCRSTDMAYVLCLRTRGWKKDLGLLGEGGTGRSWCEQGRELLVSSVWCHWSFEIVDKSICNTLWW